MSANLETPSTPDKPQKEESAVLLQLLETVTAHWSHAEQIRWTALYNFLVASTILILVWSTIYAATQLNSLVKSLLECLLAVVGIIISALWIGLTERASGFVKMYARLGRRIEGKLQKRQSDLLSDILGPFLQSQHHRENNIPFPGNLTTEYLIRVVTCVFAFVYFIFLCFGLAGIYYYYD